LFLYGPKYNSVKPFFFNYAFLSFIFP
jgi:hypothetical protein